VITGHRVAAGSHVYLYRELPDEVVVPTRPGAAPRRDIVVVDKPHFLATMPRGGHVAQTALVRLRRELELPELSPRTAGPADRGCAAVHHAVRRAARTRRCSRAAGPQDLPGAIVGGASHRSAHRDSPNHQAAQPVTGFEEPGEPNAETLAERWATVRTGSPASGAPTSCGCTWPRWASPIDNDPLYPDVIDVAADDLLRRCNFCPPVGIRRPAHRRSRSFVERASPTIRTDRPGDPMSNPVDDRPVNLKAFAICRPTPRW
jgi:tRNA pseudouridine32 synthase/23S rRNA pseudouridine746 synthase